MPSIQLPAVQPQVSNKRLADFDGQILYIETPEPSGLKSCTKTPYKGSLTFKSVVIIPVGPEIALLGKHPAILWKLDNVRRHHLDHEMG